MKLWICDDLTVVKRQERGWKSMRRMRFHSVQYTRVEQVNCKWGEKASQAASLEFLLPGAPATAPARGGAQAVASRQTAKDPFALVSPVVKFYPLKSTSEEVRKTSSVTHKMSWNSLHLTTNQPFWRKPTGRRRVQEGIMLWGVSRGHDERPTGNKCAMKLDLDRKVWRYHFLRF